MHDPTEGGLSAALYELAEAAQVGYRLTNGRSQFCQKDADSATTSA